MSDMLISNIIYFGKNACLMCDGKCNKAWGINSRPREQLSKNPDDYFEYADYELDEAPQNPGTYEGGHGKPQNYEDENRHNKWCARECERSIVVTEKHVKVSLPDYSDRFYNLKDRREQ